MADASTAYAGTADAWARGPARLYEALARVIVAASPVDLAGRHVLDAGAGTGAAAVALRERGALVTAVDTAPDMVAHLRARGFHAVVGDIRSLPFDDACFDAVVAAFSISHVDDPTHALAEARRAVRGGGAVLAGVYAAQPANPSKEAVDAVASTFGFVRPDWYAHFKADLEPRSNTPALLSRCASDAGLTDISVDHRVVDVHPTPEEMVATRMGMAHLAPFVASLSPAWRERFVRAAVVAVERSPQPNPPAILVLSSRVPA